MMRLCEIDASELQRAADWLGDEENYKWLDFGADVQKLSPISLRLMTQRPIHCLRFFTADDGRSPVGIVGLSDIRTAGTARLWYVLGERQLSGRGLATRAVRMILDHGFGQLRLAAVNAWAASENAASIRVLEKNNFRRIGIQRRCHRLDGRHVDRILFDLLPSEHVS